jgi:predicted acetyltransferase
VNDGMLRLRPLRIDDEAEVRAAHAELAADEFPFLLFWEPEDSWPAYVEAVRKGRLDLDLPAGRVPASFLVADVDGAIVGRVSIRHALNDFLMNEGGHIGYCVRPQYRRRGFATEILRQALIVARAEGVDPVLVTCDESNAASATIIERAGGRLEDVRRGVDATPRRRYWIA